MVTLQAEPKPKFELHGVVIYGSFHVYFSEKKWRMTEYRFEATRIDQDDLKRLTEAAKTEIDVPLKFGNGQGKAKITTISYDPYRKMLTGLVIKLVDWSWS